VDELWVKDACLENISAAAFTFGMEKSLRNEINLEGITCSNVPVFRRDARQRKKFRRAVTIYAVKKFSHGLDFADIGTVSEIETHFDAEPLAAMPEPIASDVASLPPCDTWVNALDLGAKGDGQTDDTASLQNAIAKHQAIYFPSGFYIVRDTLKLQPDSVLIGLHAGATQIIYRITRLRSPALAIPKHCSKRPKAAVMLSSASDFIRAEIIAARSRHFGKPVPSR